MRYLRGCQDIGNCNQHGYFYLCLELEVETEETGGAGAGHDVGGMYFVDVNKLANPDVFPDRHSAQPLQPRSHTKSARRHKSNLTGKPTKQNW